VAELRVISHRGYWTDPSEKNTAIAFKRSFDLGFGTETDVRDRYGELVIAHDPPRGGELLLEEFLALLPDEPLHLAMNIKADGLSGALMRAMAGTNARWFTFDMSVPELVSQLRAGMPAYTRASEYEQQPSCLDRAHGVWVDAFHDTWWTVESLVGLAADKPLCIVSPELHGREPEHMWSVLREVAQDGRDITLCTDLPERALTFFGAS
jgi:hypothetical protein